MVKSETSSISGICLLSRKTSPTPVIACHHGTDCIHSYVAQPTSLSKMDVSPNKDSLTL